MSGNVFDLPPTTLVMQPGTFCNLDCRYCYLPDRATVRHLDPEVNRVVAEEAGRWAASGHRVEVLWHLGEPLAVGVARMGRLWSPWPQGTVHCVQTNGTLIDDRWCDLFSAHGVRVSVSSDGIAGMNADRVTRSGRPAERRIEAGLAVLTRRRVPFDLLSVVRTPTPESARAVYAHARSVGARALGVLPEERKGVHHGNSTADRESWAEFFAQLYREWHDDRSVRLRELESVANCWDAVMAGVTAEQVRGVPVEAIPTIAHNGDVTVMSPDLAGHVHPVHGPFTVGNVLREGLADILSRAPGVPWVREALTGVARCRATCRYAAVCGGNWPANKYFESGRLDHTETAYCRNLHQAKLEGALLCRT
ncbi:radical SAM protein [Kitasatospora sp. NPDC048540]|uniref:radical SAM protein n=1 Tax=unclassified Kitasatospora TaxID=2633591 RepID=UPI0007C63A96|nr:radical SAM protein [Kitasatospora sp. MBT63]